MPALTCVNVVEDIEDLFTTSENEGTNSRLASRKYIFPKVRKPQLNAVPTVHRPLAADSIIPGTHSIYVKTWGCTHNTSDSEYMAGQLASYGYRIIDDKSKADLWLLNSCTVKNPAEDHFRNEIEAGRNLGKYLVLAGCVSQAVPNANYLKGLSIIGVQQIDRVVEIVEETLKGNSVRLLGKKKQDGRKTGGASLSLPKIRRNALIEIIAISTGCLNHCTYCKTKHARGELGSYPVEDIVERARQAFSEGVVELWITSEDTGAYGRDIGTSLPKLLWKVIEVIPNGCMLRLGMTNPPYILEHLEEMAKILNHPKVYSFLHIPVQSGSDPVLVDMKREYCRQDFENVVDFLKARVPNITIATDVICGFPTETDSDFQETLHLVEKYKFPSLFINQFFPRPGTPAAKMVKIPTQEVKKRTKKISELFASYHPYDNKVGEIQDVLVTELSTDKNFYIGHNKYYEQVLVPKVEHYMGKVARVIITETGKHYLMGKLIYEDALTSPKVPPILHQEVSRTFSTVSKPNLRAITSKTMWPNSDIMVGSCLTIIFLSWVVYKIAALWNY